MIGMGLIFLLLYLWMQYSAPPKTDQPADAAQPEAAATPAQPTPAAPVAAAPAPTDSVQQGLLAAKFGAFSAAGVGQEQVETLENDLMRVTFTNKGGRIREVFLKNYQKINTDTAGNDVKSPVRLLEDEKNRFELRIPVQNTVNGFVPSTDLFWTATKSGNTLAFRADAGEGRYLEQLYTLSPDNYQLDYKITTSGLQSVMPPGQNSLRLEWVNYLDKLEKNQTYERTMSSVYFKANEKDPDYCNCTKDDVESLGAQPVQWFAHSNQFFNTAIIARDFSFREFTGETTMKTDLEPDLKMLRTTALIPLDNPAVNMTIYTGPNEFDRLRGYGVELEDIIPFGASIFGAINRWVIHPMLDFLSQFIANKGIVILMLTLLVKLLVFPLSYRMVYSQSRMAALKPQLDELRKKYGNDQQQMSVETMKLYSEFRVNPLGGCLPVLLQMPIWFALYRFFPAAIEFRQAGFLWANDLSSYDAFIKLPFYLPAFGNHISLFTLIWVVTTLWYTWYSMRQMDTSAMGGNPMMKYMQYLMPVMFMFFFNNFASGLTAYLCMSNVINIGQTVATKRFLINNEKIKAELERNRNKPKKTGGFRERLEQAMKEQQRQKEQQSPAKKEPANKKR
jgi:YidC/Oxa1 family membrane protein insertase